MERLDGKRSHGVLLDELPLTTCGDLAELLGAVTLFGKHTSLDDLTTRQWHDAANVGLSFLRRGLEGLGDFAAQITAGENWSRFRGRGQKIFGNLYARLQTRKSYPGYIKICDALLRHVESHLSVPTGIKIFGKKVHTTHDAIHRSSRLRDQHINTVKVALSVVAGDDARNRTVFLAEHFDQAAQYLASLITRREAETLLSIHHAQFHQLLDRGCIRPSESYGNARPGGVPKYPREEIIAFLRSLRIDEPAELSDDMLPIMSAAISASVEFGDIARLLQQGKLKKVYYDESKIGFDQIYITPAELREHGNRPVDWIDSMEAMTRLGYDELFFNMVVRANLLTPRKLQVFGYRRGSNFFHVDEIDAFAKMYTTAREVAATFDIPYGTVRHTLRLQAVSHVMFEKRVIFVRSEAEAVGLEIRDRLLGHGKS